MNNYHIQQESETSARTYLIKPLILAGIAHGLGSISGYSPYTIIESSETVEHAKMLGNTPEYVTNDFEQAVTSFYATLWEKQEPLGKEFEDVLDENRWDLYVRS